MNASDPLAQLKDIHLPPPVSAWPPAPGWWIVSILLVFVVLFSIWKIASQWRRRAYRRAAVRVLQSSYAQWEIDRDDAAFQQRANQLLKQTALTNYPRAKIAALHGADWLQFLDRQLQTPTFTTAPLSALGDHYRADAPTIPAPELFNAANLWIRKHRYGGHDAE